MIRSGHRYRAEQEQTLVAEAATKQCSTAALQLQRKTDSEEQIYSDSSSTKQTLEEHDSSSAKSDSEEHVYSEGSSKLTWGRAIQWVPTTRQSQQ